MFSKDPADRDEVIRSAQLKALACCRSGLGRQKPGNPRLRCASSTGIPPTERELGSVNMGPERSAECLTRRDSDVRRHSRPYCLTLSGFKPAAIREGYLRRPRDAVAKVRDVHRHH